MRTTSFLSLTTALIARISTAAFATYVCATYKQHDRANSVLYACGWDYLRDALLLILNDHFLDVGAPLAILVAPSICLALASLVVSADERIGTRFRYDAVTIMKALLASYVLSSPWTMSLCTTLQDILQSTEDGGGDIYYQHLSKIVRVPATELLKEVIPGSLRTWMTLMPVVDQVCPIRERLNTDGVTGTCSKPFLKLNRWQKFLIRDLGIALQDSPRFRPSSR